MFREDGAHLCHAIEEVFPALENLSEGEGDGTRFNACRGDLIDERWELVIVVSVDEHDLELTVLEFVGKFESSEAAAHDDDAFFVGFWKVETHERGFMSVL